MLGCLDFKKDAKDISDASFQQLAFLKRVSCIQKRTDVWRITITPTRRQEKKWKEKEGRFTLVATISPTLL